MALPLLPRLMQRLRVKAGLTCTFCGVLMLLAALLPGTAPGCSGAGR